jgi:transcriptional activator for dhaKLM operon
MIPAVDTIHQAWETFQATGTCDEAVVAPPILRSWRRCVAAGLDPRGGCRDLPAEALPAGEAASQALIALARPYMEDLYQFMEGSGFVVLLADASLTLIELIGDPGIVAALEAAGLGRGASWRETDIGSIALNMAPHEALPWQTRGAEHFCACYHQFACSAAPLFDVAGQAIGVLGVLGHSAAAHAHTLGMVIAAAQALHAQVRNNLLLAETNDHLAELNAAIESMSEGLIFLDAQGNLSRLNSRAGQMLGLSPRSAAGRPLEELIELPAALRPALEQRQLISDQEMVFAGRKGSVAMLCSVRPLWDRGRRFFGAMITLRPPESVHRLVQQVVGAQARFRFADIIGESPAMQAAMRHARIAANSHAPVLLQGEAGVGKELFAHAIHNAGAHPSGPFVALNCAAVPRTLLMGELLGYEGGQPSHAEGRPGKLELAQSGTLLLEEVSALTVEAQTSLLRMMETQNLIRIGGQRIVPMETRIIATSSNDLEREVVEGRFRAELFYRLSVLTIAIPPLRARGDDVLLMIDQILTGLSRRLGKQVLFAPDALAALRAYPWPGNVRELEATLERLLHLTEKSVLTVGDLPSTISQMLPTVGAPEMPMPRLYDRHAAAERDAILRAGRENAGHLGHTAERLGISRATLWRKMKLYGLTKEHFWRSSTPV